MTPTEIGGKLLTKLLLKNLFSAKGKVFIASYWILLCVTQGSKIKLRSAALVVIRCFTFSLTCPSGSFLKSFSI